MPRLQAALLGAREVGFTVISMSLSLIAVFMPILLMGGIVGRLFREFAVTLSVAILVSLVVSLTTTPMMCALLLSDAARARRTASWRRRARLRRLPRGFTSSSLTVALRHPASIMLVLVATIVLNVLLFYVVPKGFFPSRTPDGLIGSITADQSDLVPADGAEAASRSSTSCSRTRRSRMSWALPAVGGGGPAAARPIPARYSCRSSRSTERAADDRGHRAAAPEAAASRRARDCSCGCAGYPGRRPPEQCAIPVHAAGRQCSAISTHGRRACAKALEHVPELADVSSDQQQRGLEADLVIDRDHRVAPRHHRRADRQHAL